MNIIRNFFTKDPKHNVSPSLLKKEMARLKSSPTLDDFYLAEQQISKFGEIALPTLIEVVSDTAQPRGYRARALETIAKIEGININEFLIKCATDPDFMVRWTAIVNIGKLQIKEALPLLKELVISDTEEYEMEPDFVLSIKKAATEAITVIESPSN